MLDKGSRATPANRGADAAARYRAEKTGAPDDQSAARRRPRPGQYLQIEDLLLGAWVFAVEEAVRRWDVAPLRILEEMSIGPAESGWIAFLASLTPIGWLFLGLLLFLLLTRGPEDTNRDVALGRRWPMLGPALPALSVYALIATGVQKLAGGLPDHKPGEEPPWPGQYVPRVIRRTAAVPIAFIGDALFRVMIGETSLGPLASPMDSNTPLLPVLFGAVVSALPFTLFVAGPRIVAGAPLAWTPWIIRFAFFYLSAWFGHYIFAS